MGKEFKWTSIDTKPSKSGRYLIFRTTGAMKVAKYTAEKGFGESWDRILAWSNIPDLPEEFTASQQIIASLRNENKDLDDMIMRLVKLSRKCGYGKEAQDILLHKE